MVDGEGIDAVPEFIKSIGDFFVHGACVSYDFFGGGVVDGVAGTRGLIWFALSTSVIKAWVRVFRFCSSSS